MADRIGQQPGNYRLTRLLGQGGFAEAYLRKQTLLETIIAIKVLHIQIAPGDLAQFQQEAFHYSRTYGHSPFRRWLDRFSLREVIRIGTNAVDSSLKIYLTKVVP